VELFEAFVQLVGLSSRTGEVAPAQDRYRWRLAELREQHGVNEDQAWRMLAAECGEIPIDRVDALITRRLTKPLS
jgi:hypothetical protein